MGAPRDRPPSQLSSETSTARRAQQRIKCNPGGVAGQVCFLCCSWMYTLYPPTPWGHQACDIVVVLSSPSCCPPPGDFQGDPYCDTSPPRQVCMPLLVSDVNAKFQSFFRRLKKLQNLSLRSPKHPKMTPPSHLKITKI